VALTKNDILLICGRYEEQRPSFAGLASAVHAVLANVVETQAVKHMVAHRAKKASSLQRKLWKDREVHSLGDFAKSLSPPMKDLAAARVLLYLREDVDPVVDAIGRHFNSCKHTLKKTDKRKAGRYSAVHLHVTCDGSALEAPDIAPITVFEVQVCTLLDHVWNELEHDIIYKQPSGEPDAAQNELLIALNGELSLASQSASRLMHHTHGLISKNTAPILDADQLHYSLRLRCGGKTLSGDFKALFELLLGLMDPLHMAALHECFQTGHSEAQARQLLSEYDPDGSHGDVGHIVVQLLPNFSMETIESFVGSHGQPPALFKLVRRVAAGINKKERSA